MKSLLIISNNVLSKTDNNGKTLYNLIKDISSIKISQLYFSRSIPTIKGYNYFQITDFDIICGKLQLNKRGRSIKAKCDDANLKQRNYSNFFSNIKNTFTLTIRELIWKDSWNSQQLERWLSNIHPDTIFFLAGNSIFAYDICNYIQEKFRCSLFTYVTDDYILDRQNENMFSKVHRLNVKKKLSYCLSKTKVFFTISDRMKTVYKHIFNKESSVLVNRTDCLFDKEYFNKSKNNVEQIFLYAGSLYYGRDRILVQLANSIKRFNNEFGLRFKKAKLHIYSFSLINRKIYKQLLKTGVVSISAGISFSDLKTKLNLCNFPVFVESFDGKEIEKTKLSFSTKIMEYLSVHKPILAIGPCGIGSMDCLSKTALCVNDLNDLQNVVNYILTSNDLSSFSNKALLEYDKLISASTLSDFLKLY